MSEFDKFARDYESILSESISAYGFSPSYFDEYKIREAYKFVKSEGLENKQIKFLNFGCGTG
ncbi:MAG: class I SAM-dependent methyltransferase, partial [Planctomycetota bacterium]